MTLTKLMRFTQALVIAIVAASALGSIALAGTSPRKLAPDWFERFAAAHPFGRGLGDQFVRAPADGRSPDTIDAALAAQAQIADGRSPDTLDAAYAVQTQVVDGRSPDTLDAARSPQPVLSTPAGGFNWGDAGVGAGFASGLLTVLAAMTMLWSRRHPRHQVRAT